MRYNTTIQANTVIRLKCALQYNNVTKIYSVRTKCLSASNILFLNQNTTIHIIILYMKGLAEINIETKSDKFQKQHVT